MKKKLLARLLAAGVIVFLPGCAGLVPWIQSHAAGITAFSMVAGAVAAGEQAVVNGIDIKDRLDKE